MAFSDRKLSDRKFRKWFKNGLKAQKILLPFTFPFGRGPLVQGVWSLHAKVEFSYRQYFDRKLSDRQHSDRMLSDRKISLQTETKQWKKKK